MSEEIEIGSGWPAVELFQEIGQQAVQAAGVDVSQRVCVKEIPCDPEQYLLIDKNGDHKIIRRHQPRRAHVLQSVDDVIRYCGFTMDHMTDLEDFPSSVPVVWVGKSSIIVTDDTDRLRGDQATYTLLLTDLWQKVCGLARSEGMSQSEFLSFLRIDMARSFKSEELRVSLVRTLRKLKKQEQTAINQGSGSYEVGLVSQANEALEWPDSFFLQIPVYDDPEFVGELKDVEVILDVRPEDRSRPFKLTPVAADLSVAASQAIGEIVKQLRDELPDTSVFLGAPSQR